MSDVNSCKCEMFHLKFFVFLRTFSVENLPEKNQTESGHLFWSRINTPFSSRLVTHWWQHTQNFQKKNTQKKIQFFL